MTRPAAFLFVVTWLISPALAPASDKPVQCPSSSFHPETDPKQDMQMFAWGLFAYVNQSIPDSKSGPTVRWETWASPGDLYCRKDGAHCDSSSEPQWPDFREHVVAPERVIELDMLAHPRAALASLTAEPEASLQGEEIRMNCPTFKHIADNHLWYLEGQEDAFRNGKEIVFPADAIEVKAFWIRIDEDVKSRYHWQKVGSVYFGLVSLNVTSKVLPNWFWATFEHVDNPNRCLAGPCRDYTSGNGSIDPGLAWRVRTLLRDKGLTEPWWLNYRLGGTQFTFKESDGTSTILANSILESNLVSRSSNTSSCMTCHARVAVDYQGNRLCPGVDKNTGYVGKPLRSWFCDDSDQMKAVPLGFVWSLQEAHSAKDPAKDGPKECDKLAPVQPTGPRCISIPLLDVD